MCVVNRDNLYTVLSSEENGAKKLLTKKRKNYGRLKDVGKKLKLQSHETGPPCDCQRKCFDRVPDSNRRQIIQFMNSMQSQDEINLFIGGLVSIIPVQRRRPRKNEGEANFRDVTYNYRVRLSVSPENNDFIEHDTDR